MEPAKPKEQPGSSAAASRAGVFVCNVDALPDADRRRYQKLREQLNDAVIERRELADGFAFRLPSGQGFAVKAKQFIEFERRCCPFLRMRLESAGGGRELWLHVTGEPGAKAFIAEQVVKVDRPTRVAASDSEP